MKVEESRREISAGRIVTAVWAANTVTVTVLAIVAALLIGAVLIIVSDPDVLATYGYFTARPADALTSSWELVSEAYANLFKGAILDPERPAPRRSGRSPRR